MARSYSSVYIHLVFSTKDRNPFLSEAATREEMHRYLGGLSNSLGCQPVIIGGASDPVHILAGLGKSASQAEWVKELKRASTKWLRERHSEMSEFSWQGGYGAFSVDSKNTEPVRRYIVGQEEHHRHISFKEEFLALLAEHGIETDERYMWD